MNSSEKNESTLRSQISDLQKQVSDLKAALSGSEEKFRRLTDSAPVGIFLNDAQGSATYINHKCAELIGVPADQALDFDWIPLLHPDDRERMVSEWENAFKNCTEFCSEYRWVHQGGKVVWTLGEVVPILGQDGRPTMFIGTLTDITEQKQASKASDAQRATLESLFESIPDATVLVNQQRRILSINKAFTNIFGYTLDEIIGKPTSVFYESEEEFLRQGRLRYNVSPEKASDPYIVTYQRKDGSLFPGETVGTKVFTPDGSLLGFFGLMRDVTDKLRNEEALRQSQKMEAIGTLSGGIAHEFNNLLAIISGNIDIVQHKQQTGINPEENIGSIRETVRRAKNLVAQILSFSRQEKPDLSRVDLTIVAADSLKLLRATIPATVEILFKPDKNGPVPVLADTSQLQQVLINLFNNAVQAMNKKGLVTVSIEEVEIDSNDLPAGVERQQGSYATISVSDTGCGIDKENRNRIFEPFFTTKDIGVGTGMGLAVAHGIVEQHGGFMTVDSIPGQGTTFKLHLPVVEMQQPEPKEDIEDALPTGTERILFVDDEECLAESCCELLEYQGYSVTSTTSSIEALDIFKKTPADFDLVFTDQTMPVMSGTELAKELLNIRPDIPIILCSGYAANVSEDEIKAVGIREFCAKPMDMKKLATVARNVLDENDSSS